MCVCTCSCVCVLTGRSCEFGFNRATAKKRSLTRLCSKTRPRISCRRHARFLFFLRSRSAMFFFLSFSARRSHRLRMFSQGARMKRTSSLISVACRQLPKTIQSSPGSKHAQLLRPRPNNNNNNNTSTSEPCHSFWKETPDLRSNSI